MTAERNRCRSEAADAGRQADRLTQRLNAMPKVPAPLACSKGLQRHRGPCAHGVGEVWIHSQHESASLLIQQLQPQRQTPGQLVDAAPEGCV